MKRATDDSCMTTGAATSSAVTSEHTPIDNCELISMESAYEVLSRAVRSIKLY